MGLTARTRACRGPLRRRRFRGTALGTAFLLVALAGLGDGGLATAEASQSGGRHSPVGHWVASWGASPTDSVTPFDAAGLPVPTVLANQTLRMIVAPHQAGHVLRIHLSNRFGNSAATFGHVTVAREGRASVSDLKPITFAGKSQVTVPAGQEIVSDPVALSFRAFTPLAVSMFMPGTQSSPTKHWNANATSLYSPPGTGDLAATRSNIGFPLRTQAWLYLDGIDVQAPSRTGAIVAFGDSITDGFVASTPVSMPASITVADKNGRYPDDVQRRLAAAGIALSVVNEGISANRVATDGTPMLMGPSGLHRFSQDALDIPGVRGVLVTEGINDLGIPPQSTTAGQLIAGYQQMISMAHARGVKIWLGTLTPASNAVVDGQLTAPMSETYREQINDWIRTQRLADGIVDFDAALRDPANPKVLNPPYSGPDHLHPNLLGYRAMADAVSLSMLRRVQ